MNPGSMKVNLTLPGDTTQSFEGEVYFLDNAVDPATGTIQMNARLLNVDEKLSAGQFLNATLVLDTMNKAVTIPNDAVQQGSEGNFVYIVKEELCQGT